MKDVYQVEMANASLSFFMTHKIFYNNRKVIKFIQVQG